MKFDLNDELIKKLSSGYKSNEILDEKISDVILSNVKEIEKDIVQIDDEEKKAILFYEMGLIWSEQLSDSRKAIISFQKSYDSDSSNLLNLQTVRKIFVNKKNWNLALDILDVEIESIDNQITKLYLEILKVTILFEKNSNFTTLQYNILQLSEQYTFDMFAITRIRLFYIENKKYQEYLDLLEKIVSKTTKFCKYFLLLDIITTYYKFKLELKGDINFYTDALNELNSNFLLVIPDINWKSFVNHIKKQDNNKKVYQLYKLYKDKIKDYSEANKLLINNYPNVKDDYLALDELENHYKNSYNWEKFIDIQGKKIKLIENPQEKSNIYYKVGDIYLNQMKNVNRAKIAFETAVKFNQHNLSAIRALSKIAYHKKDKKSLVKYHLMESKNINNPELKAVMFFRMGEIFREEKAYEFAETYYLNSLNLDSNYWPSVESLLKIYKKSKDWIKYIEILNKDIENSNNQEKIDKIKYQIGKIYIENLSDFKSAKKYLDSIPEKDYEDNLNKYLENIYKNESDWESLIAYYNKKLRKLKDSKEKIKLLFSIAKIYKKNLNDTKNSIKFLNKIVRITPNYLPAIKELGIIYKKNKNWEDLIALNLDEVKLIQSNYKKSVLFSEIANIYLKELEDVENALVYFEKAYEEDNRNIEAISSLKELYIETDKKEKFIDFLKMRIASISPNKLKSAYSCKIAEIYHERDNIKLSLQFYEDALNYENDNFLALNNLTLLYLQDNQIKKVIEILEARKLDGETYFKLAQLYYIFLDNSEKAEQYILSAISENPEEKYFTFLVRVYSETQTDSIIRIKNTYKRFLNKKELLSFSKLISGLSTKTDYIPIAEWVSIFNDDPLSFRFYDLFNYLKRAQLWDELIELIKIRLVFTKDSNEKLNLNFYLGKIYDFYKQEYSLALKYYSNVIDLEPTHLIAIKLREYLFKKTGNAEGMIKSISSSSNSQLNKADELYENSLLLINKFQKYSEATKLLELAYKEDPSSLKVVSKLAETYLTTKNYKNYILLMQNSTDIINKDNLSKIYQNSIAKIDLIEDVDISFLDKFMRTSYNYLPNELWDKMINRWMDKYNSFTLIDNYINYLLSIKKVNEAILFIDKKITLTKNKENLVSLHMRLGELREKYKSKYEALKCYKRAFELKKNKKSLMAIQNIYISDDKYTRDILKEFPKIIKNDINHIFLLEGIFHALKKLKKKRYMYNISSVLNFLNSKDVEAQAVYKSMGEMYPRYYDLYSKKISIYLFSKTDHLDFRDIFSLALQGIGKFSKKTTSDYTKLEKITSKHGFIWDLFKDIKEKTKLKDLDLYMKKDGTTYDIDFIYPDNLALVVPEAVFKINKNEIKYLLAQAIDQFSSLNFLLRYHSLNDIIDLLKGIINFILKDEIFKGKNSLAQQKIFSKGVSRSLKKELLLYEDIASRIDWKNFDFSSFLKDSHNTSIRIGLIASEEISYAVKAILKQNNKPNQFFNYEKLSEYSSEIPDLSNIIKYSISDQFTLLKELLGVKINERK